MPDVVTAPAAPLTVVARRAYPSPLNAARPSTDSLRSPTPGRLASVNLAARQFLAIAYFASLVTASDLAALTALYLLRENLYLFPLSDFAGQKTKVTQEFFERLGGSAVAEGYGGTRQGEAFHPPFYLLSHWRTPLSIPTFGFCRAKNESYIKRFGKR